ncbi:MAG: hypothetical protein A7315_07490 [Candidatus Altiarchaeales archaeon WOR_SM1_79]|nr:MAG: hypothetical protein A7315_07490 [Candidatus Altiarchaeales archaeon WOR_SM1_79]
MDKELIAKISKDFETLKGNALGILLFGSHAIEHETVRSDIDVCIVAPKAEPKEIFDQILKTTLPGRYDIKIFETLPLKIKGDIIDNHIIVWTRDKGELTYYLYKWGKVWKDQKMALRREGMEIFS